MVDSDIGLITFNATQQIVGVINLSSALFNEVDAIEILRNTD